MKLERVVILNLFRDLTMEKVAAGFTAPTIGAKQPTLPVVGEEGGGTVAARLASGAAQNSAALQTQVADKLAPAQAPATGRRAPAGSATVLAKEPRPKKVVQPDMGKTMMASVQPGKVVLAAWPFSSPAVQGAKANYMAGGLPSQRAVNANATTQVDPQFRASQSAQLAQQREVNRPSISRAPTGGFNRTIPTPVVNQMADAAKPRPTPTAMQQLTSPSAWAGAAGQFVDAALPREATSAIGAAGHVLGAVDRAKNWGLDRLETGALTAVLGKDAANRWGVNRDANRARDPWYDLKRSLPLDVATGAGLTGAARTGGQSAVVQATKPVINSARDAGRGVARLPGAIVRAGDRMAAGVMDGMQPQAALAGGGRAQMTGSDPTSPFRGSGGSPAGMTPAPRGSTPPPRATVTPPPQPAMGAPSPAAPGLEPPPPMPPRPKAAPSALEEAAGPDVYPPVATGHVEDVREALRGTVLGPGNIGRNVKKVRGGEEVTSYGGDPALKRLADTARDRNIIQRFGARTVGDLVRREVSPIVQNTGGLLTDARGIMEVPSAAELGALPGARYLKPITEAVGGAKVNINRLGDAAEALVGPKGRAAVDMLGPEAEVLHPGAAPGRWRNALDEADRPGKISPTRVGKDLAWPAAALAAKKMVWDQGFSPWGGPTRADVNQAAELGRSVGDLERARAARKAMAERDNAAYEATLALDSGGASSGAASQSAPTVVTPAPKVTTPPPSSNAGGTKSNLPYGLRRGGSGVK